jgi:uncharacterized protein YwgA
MIDRELLPLALLKANNGHEIEGRTRLQKMIFLIQQEADEEGLQLPGKYQYVPYDYGPFARGVYDDLDRLKAKNVIQEEQTEMADGTIKYNYTLGSEAKKRLDEVPEEAQERVTEKAQEIKSEFNDMPLPDLIDYVYSRYPDFAQNSVL